MSQAAADMRGQATPLFTLGQWVADVFSPHRGNEAATRALLERIGIPFIDTMTIPTPERDPRKSR